MIYFIATTSVFNECPIRKQQYTIAITRLKQMVNDLDIKNSRIIVVENNGKRPTYLDNLGCEVYYTNNNSFLPKKGKYELLDILDCIRTYNIQDNDFIVKMTGRYILTEDSEFMRTIQTMNDSYDCVIKYGSYVQPVNYKMRDCITGLIGMRSKYIKQIPIDSGNHCVEWDWANVTYLINDDMIHIVNKLGIYICPGSNEYFMV